MLDLVRPFYPSEETLSELCDHPGVQSWCLEETFRPRQVSACLREPMACLTPELKTSGRQWLIQASATAKVLSLIHISEPTRPY